MKGAAARRGGRSRAGGRRRGGVGTGVWAWATWWDWNRSLFSIACFVPVGRFLVKEGTFASDEEIALADYFIRFPGSGLDARADTHIFIIK